MLFRSVVLPGVAGNQEYVVRWAMSSAQSLLAVAFVYKRIPGPVGKGFCGDPETGGIDDCSGFHIHELGSQTGSGRLLGQGGGRGLRIFEAFDPPSGKNRAGASHCSQGLSGGAEPGDG